MLSSFHDFLHPPLSLSMQVFVRVTYGALLFGTLLMALPHGRRFFLSERWGGYAQSGPEVDVIQNPVVYPVVMVTWFLCAVLITFGWWSVWAALINLVLCRYFFVRMRWKSVLRGMGAPGFMTYWLAAGVFLLEYTLHYASDLRSLVLLILQVDFAFIMLSAGLYKLSAGYPRNQGMEFGLVNPEWGYWHHFYAKLPTEHWVIKTLNQLAWATEVVAAILMLLPQTRFPGALLIIVSFAFIATQIRLGLLCEMVMLCGALYFHPGSYGDRWIGLVVQPSSSAVSAVTGLPAANRVLEAALWTYLLLLPFAHGGLFYNFYGRKSLPRPFQRALEVYTNFFGIIVWRVFSIDLVNFFILIHHQPRSDRGQRTLISRYGWQGGLRYGHVAESITITSLFTTLKYYPGNSALFTERLMRYARTVPCPADSVLVFEYVSICKVNSRFEFVPVAEYTVDLIAGTVSECILNGAVSVRAAHAVSPVHEGVRPGSYVPLKE